MSLNFSVERLKSVVLILVSIVFAQFLLDSSSISLSGGLSNFLAILALSSMAFLPFYILRTYKTYRISSRINELKPQRVGNIHSGLNAVESTLSSRDSFSGPVSQQNFSLLKVVINYFGYWSLFINENIESRELTLSDRRNNLSFYLEEESKINLPKVEKNTDYVSGFGEAEESIQRYEENNSLGLQFFRRYFVEKGIRDNQKVTVIGHFEQEGNRIKVSEPESMPLIVSTTDYRGLKSYYNKLLRRYTLLVIALIFTGLLSLALLII